MTLADRITIAPDVMQGKPVIRGTRVPVDLILRKLAEGASESLGVVLIRFPALVRRMVGGAVLLAVRRLGDRLPGSFVVVEPGRVRVSATPPGGPHPAHEEADE